MCVYTCHLYKHTVVYIHVKAYIISDDAPFHQKVVYLRTFSLLVL